MKQVGDKIGIRSLLLLMLTFVFCGKAMAEDFDEGGLYYSTLTANTVKIVKPTSGTYSGVITIPATVKHNDKTYQVTAIGDNAFQGSSVTSVTLPLWGITSIGAFAFNDCTGLTEFTLPASITSIGERAFYYCDKLKHLYVHSTIPASYNPGSMAFSSINRAGNVCTLHVPTGRTSAYAADATFSVFTQVEEYEAPSVSTYNLYIAGVQATSVNALDILGDGAASYNDGTKTLTISGDITAPDDNTSCVKSNIYNLTINVAASATLSATNKALYLLGGATITGSPQLMVNVSADNGFAIYKSNDDRPLTISGANLVVGGNINCDNIINSTVSASGLIGSSNNLNIDNSTVSANRGISGGGLNGVLSITNSNVTATYQSAAILGWKSVTLTDCYYRVPQGGRYDSDNMMLVDAEGKTATSVEIRPGVGPTLYNLYIAGTRATSENASDILGNGVASYNDGTKTLTISGNITAPDDNTPCVKSNIYNLTINVAASATLSATNKALYLLGGATITGSPQLTVNVSADNGFAIYKSNDDRPLTISGANLVVGGNINCDNIINSTVSASGLIGSSNNLNIDNSTVSANRGISGGGLNGVLSITNSNVTAVTGYIGISAIDNWKSMTLTDCYIEIPEGSVYDTADMRLEDKNGNPVSEVIIKANIKPVKYDLYVAGVQATSVNASDIIGTGVAKYNAETNTLTICGDIKALGANEKGRGISSDIDGLIIEVTELATITTAEEGMYFTKNATITGSLPLTIKCATNDVAVSATDANVTIKDAKLSLMGQLKSTSNGTLTIQNSTVTVNSPVSPIAINGWDNLVLTGCYIETPEQGSYDTTNKCVVDMNNEAVNQVTIMPGTAPIFYDLYVAGIHANSNNALDILGNGAVSYDAAHNTLAINNNISAPGSGVEGCGISSDINDLTVLVAADVMIMASENGMYFSKSATITGASQLTINSATSDMAILADNADVTIKNANLSLTGQLKGTSGTLSIYSSTVIADASASLMAINGWDNLVLSNSYIETPEEGSYDTTNKCVIDKSGNAAANVKIVPGTTPVFYDLYVAGKKVSDKNASDILGNGAVKYEASTNTLFITKDFTASGTGLEGRGIYSEMVDLMVQVSAPATITASEEGMYFVRNTMITGASLLTITSSKGIAIGAHQSIITINGANLRLAGQLCSYSNGQLTVNSSDISASSSYTLGAVHGWIDLTLSGCYIETPHKGFYDTGERFLKDTQGNGAQEVSINVGKPDPEPNGLSFSVPQAAAKMGEEFEPPVLNNPNELPVTWTSIQEAVATINSSTGEITLVAPGQTLITATFAGNEEYLAGSASYELIVVDEDNVVITANSYEIEYGDDIPVFEYTCDGTVTGVPSITCDATKTSPVGTYAIVVTKGSVTNNNVTYINGMLTISKAPLKITAKDYTIKQGDALPTFEATYEGFKNDETSEVLTKQPVITTTATASSEPGEYEITVSGAEAQNYEITYVKGKLTITAAFIPGDVNGDGLVNVTDIVATVNFIMEKPSDGFNKAAADLSGDGDINVTDIVKMVSIIMSGNGGSSRRAAATSSKLVISRNNIQLRNAEAYTAAQFDINLSDGQSISNVVLNVSSDHSLYWKMVDANTYRVVVYSMTNAAFRANSDNLFTVFMTGSQNATISNELLIKAEGTTGIDAIRTEAEIGNVYDLNGRQVKTPRKGVYIINGRKVVVK